MMELFSDESDVELFEAGAFDSDSDSDFEEAGERRDYVRINHMAALSNSEFVFRFRLDKASVNDLLNKITPNLRVYSSRNHGIAPLHQLLLTLRFYALGTMLLSVADFVGVSKSSASRIVRDVSRAIALLYAEYVKMLENTVNSFHDIAGFPRVFGAIDCTHIPIQSPDLNIGEEFRNRKQTLSLNVQGICNAELLFMNVIARWPGSSHDATIFNNSVLKSISMWGRLPTSCTVSWDNPVYLSFRMEQLNLSHYLYDAMKYDDLSEVVMIASQILEATNIMPDFKKKIKSEEDSEFYRKRGNEQLQKKEFQKTIEFYNKALLMAPAGSLAMKLAYGNRSALMFSLKLHTAALKDIDTVFALGCPEDLVKRLERRKNECTTKITCEKAAEKNFYAQEDFFRFNVERNTEIPCASSHVGVTLLKGVSKVVATNNITVGELVAVEEAFISETLEHGRLLACHYCHKFDLNLIPCDKCCFALFCDSECRRRCNEEYHDIECHIMEFLEDVLENNDNFGICVKAAIKMWKLSKDWSEVISASEQMGRKMIKRSSKRDMFDVKKPFSLLNFDDEQHLNYGMLYNYSWLCAVLLHLLSNVPSFFPETFVDKKNAKRAMARLILGIRSFVPNLISQEVLLVIQDVFKKDGHYSVHGGLLSNGLFSFAGKLKHNCDANLMIFALGKEIALVAVKPIHIGEELTISYYLHKCQADEPTLMERAEKMYKQLHIVCSCHICKPGVFTYTLNEAQKTYAAEHTIMKLWIESFTAKGSKKNIKTVCDALTILSNVPYSEEYSFYLEMFMKYLTYFQVSRTRNTTLNLK